METEADSITHRKWIPAPLALLMAALLLSACSLTPGMRLDSRHMAHNENIDATAAMNDFRDQIRFEPITAQLVAQQLATRPQPPAPNPELSTDDTDYQYRISPQDVLQVMVWDHPELTSPAGQYQPSSEQGLLVRRDGTIFYPYVGVVKVAGMTVEEVRELLSSRLKTVIEKPQLDVRVAAFRGRSVYVTGEVAKPGSVPLTDAPLHLLDALYAAGGVKQSMASTLRFGYLKEADLQHVTLTRHGKTYSVDVLAALRDGDVGQNYLLQDGDIVHIPDNMWNKVFVLGEVKAPSSLLIHEGSMTLAEAIGDAQGVDMSTSNPGRIYVIRGGNIVHEQGKRGSPGDADQRPWVFALDARSPDALILADQFHLQPRDIIFVSTAPIVQWGRILGQLSATIQAIAIGRTLTR